MASDAMQPIRILKDPHMILKTNPLRIEVVQKFYLCGHIWCAVNLLKQTLSHLFHFRIRSRKKKNSVFHNLSAFHNLSIDT